MNSTTLSTSSPATTVAKPPSTQESTMDAVAAFERGAEGRPTDTKIQIRVAGA